MKELIRTTWAKDNYPFIDLKTYKMDSISKDSFHDLMNKHPIETKLNPCRANLELLFRLTLTKILRSYNINQKNLEFGDFVSDAYLVFNDRFEKFNPEKSNWFSYCKYIGLDLERQYKTESEKSKFTIRIDISDLENLED